MTWDNAYLRSWRFQTILFVSMFVGAAALAGAALIFRDKFESYCFERFPPRTNDDLPDAAGDPKELHAAYGHWIDKDGDPVSKLGQHLNSLPADTLLGRIEGTLIVGNRQQKRHALRLLSHCSDRPRAITLAQQSLRREDARADLSLVAEIQNSLAALQNSGQNP